ncbi:MAG: hypothetical protein ACREGB_01005 [Candidatus Saccharimonadales bacterium]
MRFLQLRSTVAAPSSGFAHPTGLSGMPLRKNRSLALTTVLLT